MYDFAMFAVCVVGFWFVFMLLLDYALTHRQKKFYEEKAAQQDQEIKELKDKIRGYKREQIDTWTDLYHETMK